MGEAEIAASALKAAGVHCILGDQNLVGVNWEMAQAVGGVKVLVQEDDMQSAVEILSTACGTDTPVSAAADNSVCGTSAGPACPECGSADFHRVPRVRIFLLLAAVFIGIGYAIDQQLLAMTALFAVAIGVLLMPAARCARCLHRWNPPPRDDDELAPLPDPADTIEHPCPRCGSFEVYRINHRRLKTWPLLFSPSMFAILPIWLVSPKQQCDSCGLKMP